MLSGWEVEDDDEPERRDSRRLRRSWKAVEDMVDEVGEVIVLEGCEVCWSSVEMMSDGMVVTGRLEGRDRSCLGSLNL